MKAVEFYGIIFVRDTNISTLVQCVSLLLLDQKAVIRLV